MALGCHSGIARWKERLPITFALAGNPNVGKSSVFNWLTGMGVTTANYPGKTVEVNLATTHFKDREIGIMDLPGTYALGSVSEDQWVARQALLDADPDAILVIVDATRLERNLYLPLQLLDLGLPVVVALNLIDEAWRCGLRIDHHRLSRLLGVPVVPTVAIRGQGLDQLVEMGCKAAQPNGLPRVTPRYGRRTKNSLRGPAPFPRRSESWPRSLTSPQPSPYATASPRRSGSPGSATGWPAPSPPRSSGGCAPPRKPRTASGA